MKKNDTKEGNPLAVKERTRLPLEKRSRQNFPIPSTMKVHRVYAKEPIDITCWAYMKLLRERDRTKKMYDVNPYAEVYQFRDTVYGILTESLDGAGDSWIYLINGPKKVLLIDTSFGLGNLKGLVEEITGRKEIIVVNTHGHYDHAYGNAQFDRVYCHKYETASLAMQDAHIWDYLFEEGTGRGIWAEFDRRDLITYRPYEIIGCEDGTVFHLGEDHEVELVHMGGHTAGHAGYLDKKNRILFAGDDIISMRIGINGSRSGLPYPEYATVNALYKSLGKLKQRMGEYDHVFSSHFVTDLENAAVEAVWEACGEIMEDPWKNYDYLLGEGEGIRYYKWIEGLGTLNYSRKGITTKEL